MFNRLARFTVLVAALGAAVFPASSMTIDEVLAKHIEASGGRDAWSKIESLKITGTFASFSKVAPFTLHRQRPNSYHMHHIQDDKLVVIGVQGDSAWWDNHWFQVGAQPIGGVDLAVVMREAQFEPALFYAGRDGGGQPELIGEADLDGLTTIGIKLTLPSEAVETWYLDPVSYLAVGRDSTGSDFGNPMPQRTFFDDYHEVAGVKLPFFTESQWYTRDRVMRIESVEVNPAIDSALFAAPAPPGMGVLATMNGDFKVATANRNGPGAPWNEGERLSSFSSLLGGALVQESFETASGNRFLRSISYDRFRNHYRVTQIDDSRGLLDVLEGDFDEEGRRLTLSNVKSGTTWSGFGMNFHTRLSIFDITEQGFKMEAEMSTDGGETWAVMAKADYSRQ